MTKRKSAMQGVLRRAMIALIVVAFALLSLPFNLLGRRHAAAEAVTAEATTEGQNATNVRASADGSTYTLKFNYYRKGGDYTDWNLWAWSPGNDGKQYDFEEVTLESKKWLTTEVTFADLTPDGDKVIGLIARKGDWAAKAVANDTWITRDYFTYNDDAGKYEGEVFMADDVAEVYKNAQDAIDHKIIRKISDAQFTDFKTIKLTLNIGADETSVFVIREGDATIATASVEGSGFTANSKSVTIKLGDSFALDFGKAYTVTDEPTVTFDEEKHFPKRQISTAGLFTTAEFGEKYHYDGVLGAEYTAEKTTFTVWSPYAEGIKVRVYEKGAEGEVGDALLHNESMTRGTKGEWTATINGDLKNKYYTYNVTTANGSKEVVDPYARSAGRNGTRGMIVDLASTNPDGWATQKNPELKSYSQAVIYEAHLRDLTIHESSGVTAKNRGKFLGLTEPGTTNSKGQATALAYLKELGITEVHFQPLFDFASVDEDFDVATYDRIVNPETGKTEFNWGYDPLNYNVPEGSYSSDPSDGAKRVNEMKQMIMALHNANIQVVMDVVYNHVASAVESNFEALMPGYYFRMNSDGTYVNGSGCGNVTASERYMFRRFMIDSIVYWSKEYKVDGFRFDLMGCHDYETMNAIYDEVFKVNPDVLLYGEGWNGGDSAIADADSAKMQNAKKMPHYAFFNDTVRDGLKGSVFADDGYLSSKGYVSGKNNEGSSVYNGARGGGRTFAAPTQSINYVACHDNSLLWDRLNTSVNDTADNIKAMYRMAATALFTSQGIAFIPAGEEMLRSKKIDTTKVTITGEPGAWKDSKFDGRPYTYLGDENYYFSDNSYRSLDHVNAINWELLDTNKDMVAFYKALIQIKRTLPQFRLTTTDQITQNLTICDPKTSDGLAFYAVKDPNSNNYAVLMFNNQAEKKSFDVPNGTYKVLVNGSNATADLNDPLSSFTGDKFEVEARSAVVMVGELDAEKIESWKQLVNPTPSEEPGTDPGTVENGDEDSNLGLALGLGIGIPAAVLIAGGVAFGLLKSKKKNGGSAANDNGEDDDPAAETPQAEEPQQEEQSTGDAPNDNE